MLLNMMKLGPSIFPENYIIAFFLMDMCNIYIHKYVCVYIYTIFWAFCAIGLLVFFCCCCYLIFLLL
jgi:hypothetical protein